MPKLATGTKVLSGALFVEYGEKELAHITLSHVLSGVSHILFLFIAPRQIVIWRSTLVMQLIPMLQHSTPIKALNMK